MTASLPGNRWDLLEPRPVSDASARRRVSICVIVRDGGDRLSRTLAALRVLDHPPELTEVVIVGVDSAVPVDARDGFRPELDVEVLTLDAVSRDTSTAARDAAAEVATGEILVFLDADDIASPTLVTALARWFDVCDHAVVLAARRFVPAGGIKALDLPDALSDGSLATEAARTRRPDEGWRAATVARTRGLTVDEVGLHRFVRDATFAVGRDRFLGLGGSGELAEPDDDLLGYRLLADGAVLIPDPQAIAWRQVAAESVDRGTGLPSDDRPAEDTRRIADRMGVPWMRATVVGSADERAASAAARIAAVSGPAVSVARASSIEVAAPSGVAFAHVWTTPEVEWGPATSSRLEELLARPDVGCVRVPGADGPALVAVTTRALSRALHDGPATTAIDRAADAFGSHWAAALALDLRRIDGTASPDVSARERRRIRVARLLAGLGRVGRAERPAP